MSDPAPVLARSRRAAREVALRAIYARLAGQEELEEAMVGALAELPLAPESQEFAWRIAEGIWTSQRELEDTFGPFLAKGWSIDRLAITDRAVLNLATWELYHLDGVPPKVTIAEAIRLSKRYGSGEGTKFVNAVLARVLDESPKANWDPALEEILDPEPSDFENEVEEEEVIEEGTPAHEEVKKASSWVIRTDG